MAVVLHDGDLSADVSPPTISLPLPFSMITLPPRLEEPLPREPESCASVDDHVDCSEGAMPKVPLVDIDWRLRRLSSGAGRAMQLAIPVTLKIQPGNPRQWILTMGDRFVDVRIVFVLACLMGGHLDLEGQPFFVWNMHNDIVLSVSILLLQIQHPCEVATDLVVRLTVVADGQSMC